MPSHSRLFSRSSAPVLRFQPLPRSFIASWALAWSGIISVMTVCVCLLAGAPAARADSLLQGPYSPDDGLQAYCNDTGEQVYHDPNTSQRGQCVWLVRAVRPDALPSTAPNSYARNMWDNGLASGWHGGSTPKPGAVMCFDACSRYPTYGHVALVVAANGDGSVDVWESNFWYGLQVDKRHIDNFTGLQGYLYAADSDNPPILNHDVHAGDILGGGFDNPIAGCWAGFGGSATVGNPFDNGGTPYAHRWGDAGYIQDFNGGTYGLCSITHKDGVGAAYLVKPPVWAKYSGLGGCASPLGWPIDNDIPAADPSAVSGLVGRYQSFEGGSIDYTESGPHAGVAFAVYGAIYAKWASLHYVKSPLGLPISDEFDAAPSPFGTTGRLNRFEGGSIYWSAAYGAHPVYGEIGARYEAQGGTGSSYGFPTGDPVVSGAMTSQTFEGGTIVVGPQMSVSPTDVVDCGTVQVGQWKELDAYTVTNNGTGTLTGSLPGVGSGTWSVVSGSPFSLTAGQSQVVRVRFCPPSVGTHTCHFWFVTNANSIDGTMQGTAIAALPLAANAGPDQAVAPGGSCTLQGSASGGVPPYTYSWSPTTGLSNPNIAQPTASPTTTTTYTLKVTDRSTPTAQTATDTAKITVVGDLNGDRKCDSADAILILRYAAGLTLPAGITPDSTWDLNHDGKIDSGDAVIVLRLSVGLPAAAATSASTRLAAQSTPVTVSLGAPKRVSASTWLVPVVVSPAQGVCAGDVTVAYDVRRVRSISGERSASTGNFLFVQNPQYGKLRVSLAGVNPLAGASGQALLNLRVASRYASWWAPASLGVRLDGIRLYDQSGRPLSVRLGTVRR